MPAYFSDLNHVDAGPPRRPDPRFGGEEKNNYRRTNRRREVSDSRIVAHKDSRSPQPACEFIQVLDLDRAREAFLRSAKPFYRHRHGESPGRELENSHGRAPRDTAGKRMNDRKAPCGRGTPHFRKSRLRSRPEFARLCVIVLHRVRAAVRQCRQKPNRQSEIVANQIPEFRPIGAVPGDDRIEAAQALDNVIRGQKAQPIETRRHDRLRAVGKSRQGYILARAPDLGILRPQGFQRRQADNEVADGARTNQKPSQMNHQL
jgi:hypothetical protein